MKKLILSTLVLALFAGTMNAQSKEELKAIKEQQSAIQKNLKQAKKLSEDATKPDFAGARAQIAEAFANPQAQTMLADINFTAGLVETNCFNFERNKPANNLGEPSQDVLVATAGTGYQYYAKAWDLFAQPDAKGKVNTKNNETISRNAIELYLATSALRIQAYDAYNAEKWDEAIKWFTLSYEGGAAPMLKSIAAKDPILDLNYGTFAADSTRNQTLFNLAATQARAGQHEQAIASFQSLKAAKYDPKLVYQSLVAEYAQLQDTDKILVELQDAVKLMPEESWFSQNLLQIYIDRQDWDAAQTSIGAIVAQDPNNNDFLTLQGQLYEMQGQPEKALEIYNKVIASDPSKGAVYSYIGRIYYNRATEKENELYQAKKYDKVESETAPLYAEALPWYEKAFKYDTNHEDNTIAQAMRTILYRQFQKSGCPNKAELIGLYNDVSDAYGMAPFVK